MAHGRRDEDERPTANLLLQMLSQNDEKHEEAHARLRASVRELQVRLDKSESEHAVLAAQVTRLATTPPDASALRFPLPLVATIVGGFLVLGGGMWSFRADVITRMDTQKQEAASDRQLQEVQYQNLKETIKTLDQQQRLQYAEFQTFRQEMSRKGR